MPNLRQRLARRAARLLFRDELAMLHESIAAVAEARHWQRVEPSLANRSGAARFGEMDDQLADLIMSQAGWEQIGGQGAFKPLEQMFTERMRQRAVIDSRTMYHMDALTPAAIDMWVDNGFGQAITVTPTDPALAPIWKEFWNAPRNQRVLGAARIQRNAQKELQDGEYFWEIWASTLDGQCTIRGVTTDAIREIVCDPDDPDVPLWYVKATPEGDVYYADWRATPDQLAAVPVPAQARNVDTLRPLSRVVMIPIQRNVIGRRGWPQMAQALIWARAYRDFIGDRATVAKKAAMYVETVTAKNTNQRGVDDIVRRLQSSLASTGFGPDRNANTTAGQTWVQNEQVSREWNSRDTGASGAQIDGLTIAGQFAATARTPLHWLGRPDAMQNQAVADSATLPWYEQMQRYQTFWQSSFGELVEVVGRMHNQYGGGSVTDFGAEVSMDSPFANDVAQIGTVLGQVASAGLQPGVAAQVSGALMKLALKALGVQDVDALLEAPAVPDPLTAPGLPGTTPVVAPPTGPSDLVRAALALEAATDALDREPAAAQPVTIITGAEGAAMLQPPVVNNHIDLSALTEAIDRLPGATDLRPVLEALANRPVLVENKLDLSALAEALDGQAVDVPALVAQIVAAVQAIPAPVVHVENVIEGRTTEKAKFAVTYDGQGRITGVTKSGETEPANA